MSSASREAAAEAPEASLPATSSTPAGPAVDGTTTGSSSSSTHGAGGSAAAGLWRLAKRPLRFAYRHVWQRQRWLQVLTIRTLQRLGFVRRRRHIVICGYPRSGTSLLYNMMASSLRGFSYDKNELPAARYLGLFADTMSKKPLDIFHLGTWRELNAFDKEIYAVIVVRDLRDVLTSRHPRVPEDYFIDYEHSYRTDLPTGPEKTRPGVRAIYDEIQRLRDGHPHVKVLIVRYESLVDDPDGEQARLAREIGVTFDDAFSKFHEHADALPYSYEGQWAAKDASLVRENKPVDRSRHGKWREPKHRARIIDQFTRHPELFAMLRNAGYEADDTWFDELRANAGAETAATADRATTMTSTPRPNA